MSLVKTYQCPNCNAPVDISPEDAIIICPSCGQAILADGSAFKDHYILENKISQKQIPEILSAFIKSRGVLRGIKHYKVKSIRPMLLPFWAVGSDAYTHYIGYRRETVSTGSGKNSRTETIYIPVDKEIKERRLDVILGRRGTSIFGYEKAKAYIKEHFKEIKPFSREELMKTEKNFEYLSSEFSVDDALNLAKTIIFDDHRHIAEKRCTKVFDCATKIKYNYVYFVHVPIWEIEYEHNNETYRIAILGNSGQILIGELPITRRYRIFFGILAFVAFVGGTLVSLVTHSSFGMAIAGVAVALISYFSLTNVFKPMSVVR